MQRRPSDDLLVQEKFYRQKTGTEHVPVVDIGTLHSLILSDESLKDYFRRRQELIDIEKRMHFSYDLESTMTDEERSADEKLISLKADLKNEYFNIANQDFFKSMVTPFLYPYSLKFWSRSSTNS